MAERSQEAFDRLVPLVYNELRALASRQLHREWRHDRLQVTTVVNEAYLRLFNQREVDWQNRGHFFGIAAQLMRRILIDHARHRTRQKRGSVTMPAQLDEAVAAATDPVDAVDALDLDRAMTKLEALDPEQARIVELRFTSERVAAIIGLLLGLDYLEGAYSRRPALIVSWFLVRPRSRVLCAFARVGLGTPRRGTDQERN